MTMFNVSVLLIALCAWCGILCVGGVLADILGRILDKWPD